MYVCWAKAGADEDDGNVFFSKQERLLNPSLLEQEAWGKESSREGGCVGCVCVCVCVRGGAVMLGIQVYGWPKEVSIIHKVRPPYAPWRRIDLAKEAGWQSDHFISLPELQITCSRCGTQRDRCYPDATLAQPQQSKVTGRSHSHYEWVMWQCKNILYTSSITVGHCQHGQDECASFKCGIIRK